MTFEPRNIGAARNARERSSAPFGPAIVISLVGDTQLRWPHVYVDPGRSYDYAGVRHSQCVIATKPGVSSGRTIAEVYAQLERDYLCTGFPLLVDVEREAVWHVRRIKPLEVAEHRSGSKAWAACFG